MFVHIIWFADGGSWRKFLDNVHQFTFFTLNFGAYRIWGHISPNRDLFFVISLLYSPVKNRIFLSKINIDFYHKMGAAVISDHSWIVFEIYFWVTLSQICANFSGQVGMDKESYWCILVYTFKYLFALYIKLGISFVTVNNYRRR